MNHQQHHSNHHKQMVKDFRKRFYVSFILSLPVLVFSPMIQNFLGYSLEFFFQDYLLFALSSIIFIYGGQPFLKGFYSEIKKREPGMMTLIAIAISVAYIYSGAVVFGLKGKMFFWELVTLIDIMLAGHWIEMKSVMGASGSLELLVSLIPDTAHKITGDEIIDISLDQIKKDDILLVKPGEKIPADGIVIEGESAINQSMLTGESIPVTKMKGDEVIGGSINGNGSLKIKVVNAGDDSYLKKVIHLVEEAQKTKSKTQHLANKAAKWLTLVAIGTGIITFISWIIAGYDISFAIERMVSVMVISCPHALGLAIPLVVAISTSVSAQHGLLIRNRTAFENARKISAIVFDKTGTLTKGEFEVSRYHSFLSEYSDKDILKIAASLETKSEHPIAQGIIQKAKELSIATFDISQFESMTGKGIFTSGMTMKS